MKRERQTDFERDIGRDVGQFRLDNSIDREIVVIQIRWRSTVDEMRRETLQHERISFASGKIRDRAHRLDANRHVVEEEEIVQQSNRNLSPQSADVFGKSWIERRLRGCSGQFVAFSRTVRSHSETGNVDGPSWTDPIRVCED